MLGTPPSGPSKRLTVEPRSETAATANSANRWVEGTAVVTVTGSRLSVSEASGASNNKICFIEISRVPDAPSETAFDAWISDPALGVPAGSRGLLDTPCGDGVDNLLKFAVGVPPMTDASHALPYVEQVEFEAATHLVLVFRQRSGGTGTPGTGYTVDGLNYHAETSGTLDAASWVSGSQWFALDAPPVDKGDGTETVRLRLLEPVYPEAPQFIRLRIEAE